jgi:hypothetical protein
MPGYSQTPCESRKCDTRLEKIDVAEALRVPTMAHRILADEDASDMQTLRLPGSAA